MSVATAFPWKLATSLDYLPFIFFMYKQRETILMSAFLEKQKRQNILHPLFAIYFSYDSFRVST